MSQSPPLERLQKLLAMTASDAREEARNAAEIACRIIREHGLEPVPKSHVRVVTVRQDPPPSPFTSWEQVIAALRQLVAEKQSRRDHEQRLLDRIAELQEETGQLRASLAEARARKRPVKAAKKSVRPDLLADGPRPIAESQYGGICRACGKSYNPGSPVYWKKSVGSTHRADKCAEWWLDSSTD